MALTDLNQCVGGWFLAYIEQGTLPPPGTSCRQEDPTATAAAARRGVSRAELLRWRQSVE